MSARATMLWVALLLAAAAVRASIAPMPHPRGPLSTARTRIAHGRIVVPVRIDGKGPFRFLLDTGANGSMVAPRLVAALGLVARSGKFERVEGVTGTQPLPWVLIRRLRVGRIVKTDVRMPICTSPIVTRLDGILGMAGFGPVRVAVDFRHHRVAISRSSPGMLWGFLDIHARRTADGLLMVPARVGGVRVEAVIDTGSPDTLGNLALRRALLSRTGLGASTPIYGVTRQISVGTHAVVPNLILGPAAIEHLPIVYSDVPIFRQWHLESRPAVIIGMDVLGSVDTLVLDYPRARVYILPAPPPISMADADPSLPGG
jgi:predicted aspartyl protease